MTRLVIDASITMAWLFHDERTPERMQVRDAVARDGALVPTSWWLEIANSLWTAERRARIDRAGRIARLDVLSVLPITADPETVVHAWATTSSLAAAHRLSVYDAAYLELALRAAKPLATLDAALHAAARREGLTTLP
ncbi:MAG TPA: type II toxin-antitoxin system VapC family toxin [Amaricoccus sp.]|uniref:type II toxin-antitoxin system VapC family toxin n=1 Tax=Amaricoccus sp. TaxID=1872485 RepID=UPI002CEEB9C5|nr:type II toxin-antitoxin system VapC family toxin [Amaricoccus sp.]HMR30178.1 type II toxin-antitoxin system VapC family toxin [Geminicoccus sp.]HMT99529.1 type II toxin-antitoxin system VapC family toxin [Amaricoccus sp.]